MKVILFLSLLVVYLIILLTNLGMIILIRVDSRLHTPMYIFLSHLSFSDLCYSTVVGPKMLVDLLAMNNSISFAGFTVQLFIFCVFTDTECVMLVVMAFDRYVVISNPLFYRPCMSSRLCSQLLDGAYLVGLTDALIHTTLTTRLCFCGSKEINHFFCNISPL